MSLSIIERVKISCWFECSNIVIEVRLRYRKEFDHDPPTDKTILKWHLSLLENDDVKDRFRTRSCSKRTEENIAALKDHLTKTHTLQHVMHPIL